MPIWQSLLFNHVIPSLFDAAASLVVVLIIFKLFRVKNPATRFTFLFLPLLKPLFVLLDNASTTVHMNIDKPWYVGLRMPDPFGFVVSPWSECAALIYDNAAVALTFFAAILAIFIVLAVRWVQLFLFLNAFKKEEQIDETEYPKLYEALDRLVPKLAVKRPLLVFTSKSTLVPFSVGYKMPIVVLSRDLADNFSEEQLEIMLTHELAHIRRRDNFFSWTAMILRDILFFNPLVRPIYRMLEEEKEKACDRMAIEKTGIPPRTVANTLVDVALFYKRHASAKGIPHPEFAKGFLYRESTLERRVNALSSIKTGRRLLRLLTTPLKLFVFVVLLYVQPFIMLNLNGYMLFLR